MINFIINLPIILYKEHFIGLTANASILIHMYISSCIVSKIFPHSRFYPITFNSSEHARKQIPDTYRTYLSGWYTSASPFGLYINIAQRAYRLSIYVSIQLKFVFSSLWYFAYSSADKPPSNDILALNAPTLQPRQSELKKQSRFNANFSCRGHRAALIKSPRLLKRIFGACSFARRFSLLCATRSVCEL